jgi:uncharacterized membrane protein
MREDTIYSFREHFKMAMALAAAAVVAWISMHLLIVCLGQSITAGEMKGRAPQNYMADLERAIRFSLIAACAAQLFIAWFVSHALRRYMRRLHLILRFGVGFVAGMGCTAILVSLSLFTGGVFVVPSFEHWLKSAIKGI